MIIKKIININCKQLINNYQRKRNDNNQNKNPNDIYSWNCEDNNQLIVNHFLNQW